MASTAKTKPSVKKAANKPETEAPKVDTPEVAPEAPQTSRVPATTAQEMDKDCAKKCKELGAKHVSKLPSGGFRIDN